jgi:hypothetical protein
MATTKFNRPGYSLFSLQRFGDALAGAIGNGLTKKIIPGWSGAADFHPNPLGWANLLVIGGIVAKVVNKMTQKYTDRYIDGLPDIIDSITNGVIVGGGLGGVFDPAPGVTMTTPAGPSLGASIVTGNIPFARAELSSSSNLMA